MPKAAAVLFVLALGLPTSLWAADVVSVSSIDADFTPEQRVKLERALGVANRVLSSAAFREQLSGIERFNDSADDGEAVYRTLLSQRRTLEFAAIAKYAIRVRVFGRWITRQSKMIASTGEGSGAITFNTARMEDFEVAYYAGTIVHELAHIAGYSHRGNRPTNANQRSVPYQVGALVRRLAEAELTPVTGLPADPDPASGGLAGALGGDTTPSATAPPPSPPRKTFAARIRRTLARWLGR